MSLVNPVEHYLQAMSHLQSTDQFKPQQWPFVTISREAGACGHTVAEALLQAVRDEKAQGAWADWQIFDQRLCELVLEKKDLQVSLDALLEERYQNQIGEFVLELFGRQSPQDLVVKRVAETVRSLAMLGKAIIVGRAGAFITRDLPGGVHIRLVAPEAFRVRTLMQQEGISEAEAKTLMVQRDLNRHRLLKNHFHAAIEDPLLYDAVWNMERVSVDTVVAATLELIRARQQTHAYKS